jgi:predicted NACHT family NTPase
LCTSSSLTSSQRAEALEKQSAVLASSGIRLVPWDSVVLSEKLKSLPEVVNDFFGREWVRAFCGQHQAELLGDRLTAEEVTRLRDRLAQLYRNVFDEQDPGLPASSDADMPSPALEDRYVLPDVYEGRSVGFARQESPFDDETYELGVLDNELRSSVFDLGALQEVKRRPVKAYQSPTTYQQRLAVEDWLTSGGRSVVLGGPGSGKSSLLRFVAKDLLKERPSLASVARKWGGFLPVWVPFAFWAKSISEPASTVRSLSEVVRRWLVHFDEEQIWPLVEKALKDERLLLLVDGLDEYKDESAATIAIGQLQVFVGQREVPAVVTSRPHGFDRLAMQSTGWQFAELAEFSTNQQEELALIWFSYRARSAQRDPTAEDRDAKELAKAQAVRFISELRRSEDIDELARVPLLLSLLIYLRFANARLPQGRFKAYKAIIDHLITKHPYRRKAAALLTDSAPSELSDDEVADCIAYLAYRVQERLGEGLIEGGEATAALKEYLMDEDLGLGYRLHEARRISRDLVEVSAGTVGLLVERSPTELGFFHRGFQEFLARVSGVHAPDPRGPARRRRHRTPGDRLRRGRSTPEDG